jgi:hypothetical protein
VLETEATDGKSHKKSESQTKKAAIIKGGRKGGVRSYQQNALRNDDNPESGNRILQIPYGHPTRLDEDRLTPDCSPTKDSNITEKVCNPLIVMYMAVTLGDSSERSS